MSLEDMRAVGVSESTVYRWEQVDILRRVKRGLYRMCAHSRTRRQQFRIAARAAGPRGAISGSAALDLMGVWPFRDPPDMEVAVPAGIRPILTIRTRQFRSSHPDDRHQWWGMNCSTTARALAECAADHPAEVVCSAMREIAFAAGRPTVDVAAVNAQLDRGRGRKGTRVLRRALELHLAGCPGVRSWSEMRGLTLIRASKVEEPVINRRYEINGMSIEMDQSWPAIRLNIEIDGPHHDLPDQRARDQRRDEELRRADWTVIRIRTWELDDGYIAVVRHAIEALKRTA